MSLSKTDRELLDWARAHRKAILNTEKYICGGAVGIGWFVSVIVLFTSLNAITPSIALGIASVITVISSMFGCFIMLLLINEKFKC